MKRLFLAFFLLGMTLAACRPEKPQIQSAPPENVARCKDPGPMPDPQRVEKAQAEEVFAGDGALMFMIEGEPDDGRAYLIDLREERIRAVLLGAHPDLLKMVIDCPPGRCQTTMGIKVSNNNDPENPRDPRAILARALAIRQAASSAVCEATAAAAQ